MYTEDENIKHGDEEEVFSGEVIGEDVLDDVDPLVEDELAPIQHHEDDEDPLFDFFGGDEDDRDGMY